MTNPSVHRLRNNYLTRLARQKLSVPRVEVKFQSQGRIGWYIQYPKFSTFIGRYRLDAFNYIVSLDGQPIIALSQQTNKTIETYLEGQL